MSAFSGKSLEVGWSSSVGQKNNTSTTSSNNSSSFSRITSSALASSSFTSSRMCSSSSFSSETLKSSFMSENRNSQKFDFGEKKARSSFEKIGAFNTSSSSFSSNRNSLSSNLLSGVELPRSRLASTDAATRPISIATMGSNSLNRSRFDSRNLTSTLLGSSSTTTSDKSSKETTPIFPSVGGTSRSGATVLPSSRSNASNFGHPSRSNTKSFTSNAEKFKSSPKTSGSSAKSEFLIGNRSRLSKDGNRSSKLEAIGSQASKTNGTHHGVSKPTKTTSKRESLKKGIGKRETDPHKHTLDAAKGSSAIKNITVEENKAKFPKKMKDAQKSKPSELLEVSSKDVGQLHQDSIKVSIEVDSCGEVEIATNEGEEDVIMKDISAQTSPREPHLRQGKYPKKGDEPITTLH
ncbi:hypothetical protein SK128_023204, partial [Halocaridina rubra]